MSLAGRNMLESAFGMAYSLPLSSVVSIAKDGTRVMRVPIGGPFYEAPVRDLTVKVSGQPGRQASRQ